MVPQAITLRVSNRVTFSPLKNPYAYRCTVRPKAAKKLSIRRSAIVRAQSGNSDRSTDRVKDLLADLEAKTGYATATATQKDALPNQPGPGPAESEWESMRTRFENLVVHAAGREKELQTALDEANAMSDKLAHESNAWQEAHAQAQAASSGAMAEVMGLRSKLAESEGVMAMLRQELLLETERVEELTRLAAESASRNPEAFKEATTKLSTTGAKLAEVTQATSNVEQALADSESQLAAREAELAEVKSKLAEAQDKLANQETEIARLTTDLFHSQNALTAAEKRIEEAEEKIKSLQDELSQDVSKTLVRQAHDMQADMEAKIRQLERQVSSSLSQTDLTNILEKTKGPLVSQLRALTEQLEATKADLESTERSRGQLQAINHQMSKKIDDLEQELKKTISPAQMESIIHRVKSPLVSQLRLVNEVHETRLKELEQSKNMAMENRVAAVVKDMNSRVSALEKEMSIMMTPKQVQAYTEKSKAPLVSQLALVNKMHKERVKEMEAESAALLESKMSAVIKTMNKKVAGLESELKIALSPAEVSAMMAKSKGPLVSQLQLMNAVHKEQIKEQEQAAVQLAESKVAAVTKRMSAELRVLEEKLSKSISVAQMNDLAAKTKAPLVSQLRLMNEVHSTRMKEVEAEHREVVAARVAAMRVETMKQVKALQDQLDKCMTMPEVTKLQEKTKAPLVNQLRLVQEVSKARLKELEESMNVAAAARVSQIEKELGLEIRKLEAALSKSMSFEEVVQLQAKSKAPLVLQIRDTKAIMQASLDELQAQLDDAVPRSKVERMQSELKAEMQKLESEMARRVDPVEVTRLIERAKGPLQSHIFSVQEQIKIKIAKLEDELANSVNAKALYALQDELKVKIGELDDQINISAKELKDLEEVSKQPVIQRIGRLFSQ